MGERANGDDNVLTKPTLPWCHYPPRSSDLRHPPSASPKLTTEVVIRSSSSHIHGIQPDRLFHTGVVWPCWVKFLACGDHGLFLTSTTWFSAFPWLSRSLTNANSVLRCFLSLCFPQSRQRQALSKDCSEHASVSVFLLPLWNYCLSPLTIQGQESYRPFLIPFCNPWEPAELYMPWCDSLFPTPPYSGMHTQTHMQAFPRLHCCSLGWWKEQLYGKPLWDWLYILQNCLYSK